MIHRNTHLWTVMSRKWYFNFQHSSHHTKTQQLKSFFIASKIFDFNVTFPTAVESSTVVCEREKNSNKITLRKLLTKFGRHFIVCQFVFYFYLVLLGWKFSHIHTHRPNIIRMSQNGPQRTYLGVAVHEFSPIQNFIYHENSTHFVHCVRARYHSNTISV